MAEEGDYLRHLDHLTPVGSYGAGRSIDGQHDPGVWSEEEIAWYNAE